MSEPNNEARVPWQWGEIDFICPACGGEGMVDHTVLYGLHTITASEKCRVCRGKGTIRLVPKENK